MLTLVSLLSLLFLFLHLRPTRIVVLIRYTQRAGFTDKFLYSFFLFSFLVGLSFNLILYFHPLASFIP